MPVYGRPVRTFGGTHRPRQHAPQRAPRALRSARPHLVMPGVQALQLVEPTARPPREAWALNAGLPSPGEGGQLGSWSETRDPL